MNSILSLACAQCHAACRVGKRVTFLYMGLSCLHQDCWASCVFCTAGSLHLGDSYERKRASSSFSWLSGTEMATAQVAGGIWWLGWGIGNWAQSQRWEEGSNKPWVRRNQQTLSEKNYQPVLPRYHHRWPDSSVFWFNCSFCYYFSICGCKCSNAAKLAILSGTVRAWPCQALHVLDRKALNKIFQVASFLLNLNDLSTCISKPVQCKLGSIWRSTRWGRKLADKTFKLLLFSARANQSCGSSLHCSVEVLYTGKQVTRYSPFLGCL